MQETENDKATEETQLMSKTMKGGAGTILATALLLLSGVAPAQVNSTISDYDPGSILIFPVFTSDFTNGYASLVSVSNTNGDRRVAIPGLLRGDVQLHYFWIDGSDWSLTNDQVVLTPNDTRSILTDFQLDSEEGFLIVTAEDPETSEPIDFDFLIGDIVLIDVAGNRTWCTPGIGIQGLVDERLGVGAVRSTRGHAFTDAVANGGDGGTDYDFNGFEYQRWPSILYLSSFFRQAGTNEGELILLGDLNADWRIDLLFIFYDRDEGPNSRTYSFTCWTRQLLSSIAAITTSAVMDPAGWARIDTQQAVNPITGQVQLSPNILGAVVQRVVGQTGLEFGHLLHHSGLNSTHAVLDLF